MRFIGAKHIHPAAILNQPAFTINIKALRLVRDAGEFCFFILLHVAAMGEDPRLHVCCFDRTIEHLHLKLLLVRGEDLI